MGNGVSIQFFTGAVKLLGRIYPEKQCGPALEEFRAALAAAEDAFRRLPDVPKSTKTRKRG